VNSTGTLTPEHAYNASGVYNVTLTVVDDDGGVGADWLLANVSESNGSIQPIGGDSLRSVGYSNGQGGTFWEGIVVGGTREYPGVEEGTCARRLAAKPIA
jgi:hypothetical protein